MPRAATSVATSTETSPSANLARVWVRCGCDFPLCRAPARTPAARRCRVKRSTPALVSRNISTRPSRAAISVAVAYLSAGWTTSTWCSIAVTEADAGSTDASTGSWRRSRTSWSTSWSRVAENSSRCPSEGTWSRMPETWGRNPMSHIWSASSSTVIRTWSSRQSRRATRSARRPGVATTTSAPSRSAWACRLTDSPPTTVVRRRSSARAYGVSASLTCWASSRVDTRTRASGRLASARRPAVLASRASPKASVLPDPVRARPSTSRPASASGRVAAWIGKGSLTPRPVIVSTSAGGSPRASKEGVGCAFMGGGPF